MNARRPLQLLATCLAVGIAVGCGGKGWDDNPQDYIGFWTNDGASPLSSITLAQLLSFTSGLEEQALCQNLGAANFANCVETIYDNNLASPVTPGSEFHYGSSHLQVAGLMAVLATFEELADEAEAWAACE
ncbi:MAG: hypothetical protein QF570_21355 [Myxococcota bacterium]|jgi:CubicO group peptidase (beta-lactamase class C family)|nr:hypothetical protein [Myxococcota bacterium]